MQSGYKSLLILVTALFQIITFASHAAFAGEEQCEDSGKHWQSTAWPAGLKIYAPKDASILKAILSVHGDTGYFIRYNGSAGIHAADAAIWIKENHEWKQIFQGDANLTVEPFIISGKTSNGFYNLCDPFPCCGGKPSKYYFNGSVYGNTPAPKSTGEEIAGNLVINGGVESSDFADWHYTSQDKFSFVDGKFIHSGLYAAFLGDRQQTGGGTLSQILSTTPGTDYLLSFWFAGNGDAPSGFLVTIGGHTILDLTNPPDDKDYKLYTFRFTATAASTLLQFHAYDDKSGNLNLDDVSVVPAQK